jgi:hypothetical protein
MTIKLLLLIKYGDRRIAAMRFLKEDGLSSLSLYALL